MTVENTQDVYQLVPKFESENWLLQQVSMSDAENLLKVYSDKKAVPFFNADNCNGDTFYYDTEEKIKNAIHFWMDAYAVKVFVRWSIMNKEENAAVGTIELFHRDADDFFTDTGLLRLDLRSDYENEKNIKEILQMILPQTFDLFDCHKIATKAVPEAKERIQALQKLGFYKTDHKLIGHDGTSYGDYFVIEK